MSRPSSSARPVAVELCCGMGGIGVGLRAVGFNVARAYDSWDAAVAVYNHNAGADVARTCDLLSSSGRELVGGDARRLSDVALLAAGPPCKGFSQLRNGHHDSPNPHNRVFEAMPAYVALLRPRLVLIENVPDLVRHQGGSTLAGVLRKLARPGPRNLRYRVEHAVYDAALFGTPQARRRMLIFAVRTGSGDERLPAPGPDLRPLYAAIRHGGSVPKQFAAFLASLKDPEDLSLTSARQALSDLPDLGQGQPETPRAYRTPSESAYQRLMRKPKLTVVTGTRTPGARPETVTRLRYIDPGRCARCIPKHDLNGLARRYDSAYRRLHPDVPSTALSTRYDCAFHYKHDRSLSLREYARLQSIPDDIEFPESIACRRSAYEMIGNAVPPLLVQGVLAAAMQPSSQHYVGAEAVER